MQNYSLPIQLASTAIAPAPPAPRISSAPENGPTQFAQALERQVAQQQMQEQQQSAAAVASSQPAPAKAQAADAAAGTDAAADKAKEEASDAQAGSPVAALLALVASFNPPAGAASALAAAGKASTRKESTLAIDGASRFSQQALTAAAAAREAASAKPQADAATALSGAARDSGAEDAAGQARSATDPASALASRADLAAATPPGARDSAPQLAALKDTAPAALVTAPLPQASLAMAQALGAAPAERIAAPVGSPAWDQQVGQKIVWMVAGKEQSATLTLNPPDLGPLQVVLNVTGDQASVTFSAAQPEVRQALENALPQLRDMLGESGIALGNASVNAGMPDQRQARQGEAPRQQGASTRVGGAGEVAPAALAAARTGRTGSGLVDTFA